MGFVCFRCGHLILGHSKALIWHFKNIHSLVNGRYFTGPITCMQDGCMRTFKNHVSTFKSHVEKKHEMYGANEVPLLDDADELNASDHNSSDDNEPLHGDHDEQPIPNVQNWDDFDKAEIEQRIAIFLAKLLASSSVVQSTIDGVVGHTSDLLDDVVGYLKHKTSQFAQQNMIQPNDLSFCSLMEDFEKCENTFDRFIGVYMRKKYFTQSGVFLAPKEIPIAVAFYQRRNRMTGNVSQVLKNVSFQYVPIKPLMKLILESKGFLESIEMHEPSLDGLMRDFHDGEYSQQNIFCRHKRNIQLLFYIDDFEVANPLSPKAGTHKLGAVYCTITNIHPKFRSSLNNCHLVMLFNAGDAKLYGYEPIFDPLVEDLNSLIHDGIQIEAPTFQGTVRVGLAQVTGDNLGLHSLFGFAQGFTANYPCRFCKMHRAEAQLSTSENVGLLRTKDNYQMDVNAQDLPNTGVRSDSPLNKIHHYHVTQNFAPDIMHDLLEGVCPLELKLVVKALIDKRLFNINLLNSRLVSFNYGSGDNQNKPCIFSASSMTNPDGAPGQNAAQMWCLIRHFPLMMGDLVPEDDEHWELLILLLKCMDIIFSPVISRGDTVYLKHLIQDHHQHFLEPFGNARQLKPKHHHMIHYPMAIQKLGPLTRFWAMRFEAKHNFSRRLSHIVCNFQNIAKTLAYRNQMLLCYNLLSQLSLVGDEVEIGPGSSVLVASITDSDVVHIRLRLGLYDEVFLANWCKVFGHTYKKHQMVVVGKNVELDPVFGKLVNIIAVESGVRLIYEEWLTTGFSRHLHAYKVEAQEPRKTEICRIDDLLDYHPLQMIQSGPPNDPAFCVVTRYKF